MSPEELEQARRVIAGKDGSMTAEIDAGVYTFIGCRDCGSIIYSVETHAEWHQALRIALAPTLELP